MQQPMIATYDKKTALFGPPFVARHIGEAIREWDIVRKDTNTKFGKNPEDFDLYQIGYFDDESAQVELVKPHIHLSSGV